MVYAAPVMITITISKLSLYEIPAIGGLLRPLVYNTSLFKQQICTTNICTIHYTMLQAQKHFEDKCFVQLNISLKTEC